MKSLTIKAHSIVDVITNSSTVIYTQAKEGSIETVKEIINSLLKLGGSDKTSDDLFDIKITSEELIDEQKEMLRYGDDFYGYGNGKNTKSEFEKYTGREFNYSNDEDKKTLDELWSKIDLGEIEAPSWWERGTSYVSDKHQCNTEITVIPKVDDKQAKLVASLLSTLQDLFVSEERYNG